MRYSKAVRAANYVTWGILVACFGSACGDHGVVTARPLLVHSPLDVEFGGVPVGLPATQVLGVSNRGETPLQWEAAFIDDGSVFSLSAQDGRLLPGESVSIDVRLLAEDAGPLSTQLRFKTNNPDRGEIFVSVSALVTPEVLSVSAEFVDFGPVRIGTSTTRRVELHNMSPDRVRLSVSTQPQDPGLTLLSDTVVVLGPYEPTQIDLQYAPEALGALSADLQITGDCIQGCDQVLPVSGRAVPSSLVCAPAAVQFGYTNLESCTHRTLACTNVSASTVRVHSVALTGQNSRMSADHPELPQSLDSGEQVDIEVTHCPEAWGESNAQLNLHVSEPDDQPTVSTVALQGRGGGPNIRLEPQRIYFGATALGAERQRTLTIRNVGNATLTLAGHRFEGAAGSFEWRSATGPQRILAGSSLHAVLRYRPDSLGPQRPELVLLSDDPDTPEARIVLDAEAIGLGRCTASLQPPAHSFGLVDVHGTTEASITLSAGDAPCRWSDPRVLGDAGFRLSRTPARSGEVQAGQSVAFAIEYHASAPTTLGGDSAVFRIDVPHALPDELQVALTAQAAEHDLLIWPPSIDFGPRPLAEPALRSVFIFNTGTTRHVLTGFDSQALGLEFRMPPAPVHLNPDESLRIDLVWTPRTAALLQSTLSFRSSALPAPLRVQIRGDAQIALCGHIQASICAPNGDWPAVGAQVKIQSRGGQEIRTTTNENGALFAHCLPDGPVTVEVTQGHYTASLTGTVRKDRVEDLGEVCLSGPNAGQVAVLSGVYDDVQRILDAARLPYTLDPAGPGSARFFTDLDLLLSFDVVLIACGFPDQLAQDPQVAQNLRTFVDQGGSLYVSDLAYNMLEAAVPEAIDFLGDDAIADAANAGPGAPIVLQARVLEAEVIRQLGGSRFDIALDLPYVRVDGADPSATIIAAARTSGPTAGLKPLAVVYRPTATSGTVVYTTVHESSQLPQALRRVLQSLIYRL